MAVCIELSAELESTLRRQVADLDRTAKEALLVDLFRRELLTQHELAEALGITRLEADEVLGRHGVVEDLPTAEEIRREAAELAARFAPRQ